MAWETIKKGITDYDTLSGPKTKNWAYATDRQSDYPVLSKYENVNWRQHPFGKKQQQTGRRIYSEHPNLNTVEWYQSPLGTRAGMKVEPEWFHQRGGENYFTSPMITPEIMDLYQDEESDYYYNQGGIASLENRPGYAWGGYKPGETYSYQDLRGNRMLGSEITWKHPMARDNPLIQDVGGHDIGSAVRDRDLFTQMGRSENYQWDPKKKDEYGFAENPLYGDQEYIKDEYKINPYFGMFDERFKVRDFPWMNEGGAVGLEPGIASLENRPGYAWGGESGSYDIEKAPWQPLPSGYFGKSDWQYSGNRDPEGRMTGTWRDIDYGVPGERPTSTKFTTGSMDPSYFNTQMNPYYDDEIARRQNVRRADVAAGTSYGDDDEFADSPRFTPAAPIDPGMWGTAGKTYGTTPDEVRPGWDMEGPSETPPLNQLYRDLEKLKKNRSNLRNLGSPITWPTMGGAWALKKLFGGQRWNEGGAVGLEPGIASLMGYAKGGMVTKVRVPKGQSKWMKKFMNNMRDK